MLAILIILQTLVQSIRSTAIMPQSNRVAEIRESLACTDRLGLSGQVWVDDEGEGCEWYSQFNCLLDSSYTPYLYESLRNDGYVADEACCVCGVGSRSTDTVLIHNLDEGSGDVTVEALSRTEIELGEGCSWRQDRGLDFNGARGLVMQYQAPVSNSFSISFSAQVTTSHRLTMESTTGVAGTVGMRYAFGASQLNNNLGEAGVGVSMGTNGISVIEHAGNYMPSLAVWRGQLLPNKWYHVTIVYDNQTPKIYLNGRLVHVGLQSSREMSVAPTYVGFGPYSDFVGALDQIKVYDRVITDKAIFNECIASGICLLPVQFSTNPDEIWDCSALPMLARQIEVVWSIGSGLLGGCDSETQEWAFLTVNDEQVLQTSVRTTLSQGTTEEDYLQECTSSAVLADVCPCHIFPDLDCCRNQLPYMCAFSDIYNPNYPTWCTFPLTTGMLPSTVLGESVDFDVLLANPDGILRTSRVWLNGMAVPSLSFSHSTTLYNEDYCMLSVREPEPEPGPTSWEDPDKEPTFEVDDEQELDVSLPGPNPSDSETWDETWYDNEDSSVNDEDKGSELHFSRYQILILSILVIVLLVACLVVVQYRKRGQELSRRAK
jgi:hypothetical protein